VFPGSARRGQDLAGAIHRPGARPAVRAHLAGRGAGRGGDPRPPPHLRGRHAGADHPGNEAGRGPQPGVPAG
jgi:hypothetical protein